MIVKTTYSILYTFCQYSSIFGLENSKLVLLKKYFLALFTHPGFGIIAEKLQITIL